MDVFVRDMKVGKKYIVSNTYKTLTSKQQIGAGGAGFQEPYFSLIFDYNTELIKDWDCTFIPGIG
tara:strand:+ start:896 stop:1090 length:195 start_codon:yes stop_codon:yes gene_type:complete